MLPGSRTKQGETCNSPDVGKLDQHVPSLEQMLNTARSFAGQEGLHIITISMEYHMNKMKLPVDNGFLVTQNCFNLYYMYILSILFRWI